MTRSLLLFLVAATVLSFSSAQAATTVDFEDLTLPDPNTSQPYYNGDTGSLSAPAVVNGSFTSRGAGFNNEFQLNDYGLGPVPYWSGFSYSRTTDTVTPGPDNQYSAVTGSGAGGSQNYGVAFDQGFGTRPTISLPTAQYPVSIRLTNTTYAYRAIVDGVDNNNGFSSFVRQFGDDPNLPGAGNQGAPDLFLLTITGRDSLNAVTGTIDVPLADYTFADNADDFTVNTWLPIDLTSLGTDTRMLEFSMSTTDTSTFGNVTFPNTPFYFALDDLVVAPLGAAELPEPASWLSAALVVLMCAAGGLVTMRRRKVTLAKNGA